MFKLFYRLELQTKVDMPTASSSSSFRPGPITAQDKSRDCFFSETLMVSFGLFVFIYYLPIYYLLLFIYLFLFTSSFFHYFPIFQFVLCENVHSFQILLLINCKKDLNQTLLLLWSGFSERSHSAMSWIGPINCSYLGTKTNISSSPLLMISSSSEPLFFTPLASIS